MILLALLPAAYALGMFPSAVIVARASGIDITTHGSGNPGASNVGRVLGWKRGVLVFVLDAAKGAISAAVGWALAGRHGGYFCAGAATVGHMFPVLHLHGVRFRGGKGVATAGGAMFVIQPIVSPALIAVWLTVSRLTNKASLASLVIIPLLPLGAALLGSPAWEIVAIALLGIVVMLKHTSNIKRLIRREELSVDKNR